MEALIEAADILSLSLPPERSYRSFEELYTAAQAHAKLAGYAFVTSKSKSRKGRKLKFLHCKRAGTYRTSITDEDHRTRNRISVKNKCPVLIKARERPNGSWDLCHRAGGEAQDHNHCSGEPAAFPEHRRLNQQQAGIVASHYSAGISASRTVTVLQNQAPLQPLHHRDVYNINAALTRAKRRGKSPPEALIAHLEAEKIAERLVFEY